MTEMNSRDYLTRFESTLTKTIMKTYPHSWDEDHITYSILEQIQRKFHYMRIFGYSQRMLIDWQIYKQSGMSHYNYGDIGLLVRITYQDGDSLEGVGFLEAKKRSRESINFDGITHDQTQKIYQNAENAMALLYDYEDISRFANIESSLSMRKWFAWKPCTHCTVVPMRLVLETQKRDTSLYKYSLPFSYQVFYRYFNGFDLDFTDATLATAKGFAKKEDIPKYLVITYVTFDEMKAEQRIEVNNKEFSPIRPE